MAKTSPGELATNNQFDALGGLRDLGIEVSPEALAAYAGANQVAAWDSSALLDHADRIRSFEYQPTNSPDDLIQAIEARQAEYVAEQVQRIVALRDRTAGLIQDGVAAVQPVNFRAVGSKVASALFPTSA